MNIMSDGIAVVTLTLSRESAGKLQEALHRVLFRNEMPSGPGAVN